MSAKRIKRKSKQTAQYIPLEDIKTIDDAFLTEINNVRMKLSGCDDEKLINAFNEVLVNGYKAAIELKALEREVDYNIKFAKIEAREREQTPWRRGWWWRLIFRPVTNRPQDIIEERAELDAERVHGELEKQLDDDWEQLFPKKEKLSKRELRRQAKKQLKAAIKAADNTETNEAFDALTNDVSPKESTEQAAEPPEPPTRKPRKSKQQLGVNPL